MAHLHVTGNTAPIDQRGRKHGRHAGTDGVCRPPHASDDTRIDLSNTDRPYGCYRGERLTVPGPSGPSSPATAQQRVEATLEGNCPAATSRARLVRGVGVGLPRRRRAHGLTVDD